MWFVVLENKQPIHLAPDELLLSRGSAMAPTLHQIPRPQDKIRRQGILR
jgi:hypothetical protein